MNKYISISSSIFYELMCCLKNFIYLKSQIIIAFKYFMNYLILRYILDIFMVFFFDKININIKLDE